MSGCSFKTAAKGTLAKYGKKKKSAIIIMMLNAIEMTTFLRSII